VIFVGAPSLLLSGAAPWWVGRIGMWRTFFPRVLLQVVGLKGLALHQLIGRGLVQIGLHAVAARRQLAAREHQFARQLWGRIPFRDAA
jgi:hypothetical protein